MSVPACQFGASTGLVAQHLEDDRPIPVLESPEPDRRRGHRMVEERFTGQGAQIAARRTGGCVDGGSDLVGPRAMAHLSSLDVAHVGVARSGNRAERQECVKSGQVIGGQGDVEGGDVFLQVAAALGARDRHHVAALGEQPGQGELTRRTALSAAICTTRSTRRWLRSKLSPWNRGLLNRLSLGAKAPGVVRAPVRKPRPSGLKGTNPMPSWRTVASTASSGSRLNSDHSLCRALIGGWHGPADAGRLTPPTTRDSGPCRRRQARPWRRWSPR